MIGCNSITHTRIEKLFGIGYEQVFKERIARSGLAMLFLLLLTTTAFGQGGVSRYTVATETGTWIDATTSGGTRLGGSDDSQWPFNLPFDVVYDSTTVFANTRVAMTDDGDFSFKNFSGGYSYCTDELGSSSYPGAIAVFNIDWIFNSGSPRGDWWIVTGSAPNRILTMEWYQNTIFAGSTTTNFELQIHETTGVIEILYADHSLSTGTSDCGHGAYVGLNGMTAPTTDYIGAASNITSLPSTDFSFTPPPPPPGPEFTVTPKSVNFGPNAIGQGDTICTVTAYSIGVKNLHITGVSIAAGQPDFTIVSGPVAGDSIVVGQSKNWCLRFSPITAGSRNSVFTVQTDARDSNTQQVTLTGVGAAPAVSYGVTTLFHRVTIKLGDTSAVQYIPVTSTGVAPLTFNSIYFIGLDANSYFVSRMPASPLAPGVTDSIGVRFSPRFEGRPDAQLVINTNAVNNPSDTVGMFGTGRLPHLVIAVPAPGMGNMMMFDSVALGDSVCQSISLTNTGSDTVRILKQLVTYGDYDFSFYPLAGADTMIVPGGSKLVNVCFKPLKNGSRQASIRFYTDIPKTFEIPRRDTSQFVINVTGIGVPYGRLAITGPLTDTALVGKSNCITDTFKNVGLSELTVNSVAISGPNGGAWTITSGTPFSLGVGQSKLVTLCFGAQARGSQFDTLVVNSVTSEHSFSNALPIVGVSAVSCATALPTPVIFGADSMTAVGKVDTACVTITNCGDFAATYTAALGTGSTAYALVPPMTSAVIAPGGTATFCATFTPSAIGAAGGTLNVTGGPSAIPVTLGGVGAGVTATAAGALTAPVMVGACQDFVVTITNNGNISWIPGAGSIGGLDSADFTIKSGPTPPTIAAGGTATVTITFCPKKIGSESMALTFPSATPALPGFSYPTSGIGAASSVTIKTEQDGFMLGQSYPNPMAGTADLQLTLPREAPVRIDLLDATGALVKTAFNGTLGMGTQSVKLDAKDLPSGTYFYTLTSGDVRLTRQLILLK